LAPAGILRELFSKKEKDLSKQCQKEILTGATIRKTNTLNSMVMSILPETFKND